MISIETHHMKETRWVAQILAKELVLGGAKRRATVVALQGELGAGKTTFSQGFARALGITERVRSPTFVLMKIYPVRRGGFF